MAYDDALVARIRTQLGPRTGLTEKRMFGGYAFLLNGNMCCGVNGPDLIARLDPSESADALASPHTRPFDLTGRPMKGWVLVGPAGTATDEDLVLWLERAVDFASGLRKK